MGRQIAIAIAVVRNDPHFLRGFVGFAGLLLVLATLAIIAQGAIEGRPA